MSNKYLSLISYLASTSMCNFELETEYYTPLLSYIYHAISNTSQVLTVTLFPPIMYLILKKSQKLGKYKNYMLIHTVDSFFFSSFIWLVKPTALFRKYGIAFCGPIADIGIRELTFSLFFLMMSSWVNVSVSFSMSIFYRSFAVS